MSTFSRQMGRRCSLAVAAGVGIFLCGCTALAAGTSGRQPTAQSAQVAASTPATQGDAPDSSTPPGWPWRGVAMGDNLINGATPADIDEFVRVFGINSVHLYLAMNHFQQRENISADQAWTKALAWLDSMIEECKKDHIVAIVHLDQFPKPGGGYYAIGSAGFWDSNAAMNEVFSEVAALAKHLHKFGPELAAYDIFGEPVVRTGYGPRTPPNWDQIQPRIVQTLRKYDPGRWVVVEPGPWGGAPGYANFTPLQLPKLVYSVHVYAPQPFTHQGIRNNPFGVHYPGRIRRKYWDKQTLKQYLSPVVRFQQRYGVLIYVGEFSAVRWAPGSRQYLQDLVSIFNAHGWGWAYFDVGGWNGWDPRFDSSFTPGPARARQHMTGSASERWQTLKLLFQDQGGG